MEIEKDRLIEVSRKGNEVHCVYVPSDYPGPIAIDSKVNQPERLNPETLDKEKDEEMGKYYASNILLTEMR